MKKIKLKSLKNRNNMLKIFSLIFAIFLWSYVRSEVDPERTITFRGIPVNYENVADLKNNNLIIISPDEAKVNVTLKGKQSNIQKVKKENVVASVNLAGYFEGEHNVPIKVQVDASNIIVDSKDPETIAFKIDKNINRRMRVELKTVGTLPDDYVLGNIKKEAEVIVSGPKSYIESIDRLVAIVDVSGKSESTVISAPIVAYNKDGAIIDEVTTNPKNIDIEIPILKTETVPVKLRYVGEVPNGIDPKQFSVEPNSVSIKGNSALIKNIKEVSTEEISVEKLLKGETPIEIILPDGITLVDTDLKFVASPNPIELNEKIVKIPVSEIKVKNLEEHYGLDFIDEDKTIEVKLMPKDPMANVNLSDEDVYASIDVKNLSTGEHNVKVDISVPEDYRIISVSPKNIVVKYHKNKIF